jgi:hypothetical protein
VDFHEDGQNSHRAPCVRVCINSLEAVQVALQLVSQEVGVALLLPEHVAFLARGTEVPPRQVEANAAGRARALLATDLSPLEMLSAAAEVFGVAQWPAAVASGRILRDGPPMESRARQSNPVTPRGRET